jgi:hypothetical protein
MFEGFDILEKLTASVRDRLKAGGGFDEPPAVEVLTERLSDLEQRIRLALQSKLGLCLIVSTPEVEGGESPFEIIAKVSVLVNENVAQNQYGGTRITAQQAALRAYVSLLNWEPPGGWSNLMLIPDVPAIRLVGGQTDDSPIVTYEVALRAVAVLSISDEPPTPLSGTP